MLLKVLFTCLVVSMLWSTSFGQTAPQLSAPELENFNDSIAQAQVDSVHEAIDNSLDNILDSNHIEVGFDASSKSIFIGRLYGVNGIIYNPNAFVYCHKSGFGFSIVSSIWQKASIDSTITDLNVSYQHTIANWWSFEIDYIYWIFHHDFPSSLDFNNLIDFSNTFKFKDWLNTTTDIVFMFGADNAFVLQEYISHPMYLYPSSKHMRLSIEPELGVYFGDPNIYARRNIVTSPPDLADKSFGMLDYYATLHTTFQLPRWSFGLSYEVDMPQSAKSANLKATSQSFFTVSLKRIFAL